MPLHTRTRHRTESYGNPCSRRRDRLGGGAGGGFADGERDRFHCSAIGPCLKSIRASHRSHLLPPYGRKHPTEDLEKAMTSLSPFSSSLPLWKTLLFSIHVSSYSRLGAGHTACQSTRLFTWLETTNIQASRPRLYSIIEFVALDLGSAVFTYIYICRPDVRMHNITLDMLHSHLTCCTCHEIMLIDPLIALTTPWVSPVSLSCSCNSSPIAG